MRLSIRGRLTVWFSVVLAVCLAAADAAVWTALRHRVMSSVERDLDGRVSGLCRILQTEAPTADPGQVRIEMEEYAAGMTPDQSVRVWDHRGHLLFAWPGADAHDFRTVRRAIILGGRNYSVEVGASLQPARDMLRLLRLIMMTCIPLIILLAAAGGWWLSRTAMSPVDAMTREAHRLGIRNLSARLPEPDTGDELARFARAWNELLARLQAAVERLSRFTADASHELRSPVALIRTTAELALRQNRAPEEYRRALVQIQAESRRMTELIEGLLTLARCDEGTPVLDSVNLGPVISQASAERRGMAVAKGVTFVDDYQDPDVAVMADAAMLKRLIVLLLDNAIKYTPAGGQVSVMARPSESAISVEVSDTGLGITAEDLPHIFDRFWRADPARSSGGAGLGLSLAQAIATAHGAVIEAESTPGVGSTFRFAVKRARTASSARIRVSRLRPTQRDGRPQTGFSRGIRVTDQHRPL